MTKASQEGKLLEFVAVAPTEPWLRLGPEYAG